LISEGIQRARESFVLKRKRGNMEGSAVVNVEVAVNHVGCREAAWKVGEKVRKLLFLGGSRRESTAGRRILTVEFPRRETT